MQKVAVVTGVTGQDGSYMAELLLSKEYRVVGITRRTSTSNTERIRSILEHPRFTLRQADMCDFTSLLGVFQTVVEHPQIEVYNLAAQSQVHTSFSQPEYTADVDGLGTLRILECIRVLGLGHKVRMYQASTSELYGKVVETPQTEMTPFYPRSPYGVAKLYAFWIVKNYRESYGMYVCNGILFNHESERRGADFITRKVTLGINKIYTDPSFTLELGNLDAKRDWGHAEDYVYAMWLMLQQDKADDYVIASGETHSVREFVELAFRMAGHTIRWEGRGTDEVGKDETGRVVLRINPAFYRPAEVELLIGDASRAESVLGWKRNVSFEELVKRMVTSDQSAQAR
jgi:GDPmannose 4,6-dehydratase